SAIECQDLGRVPPGKKQGMRWREMKKKAKEKFQVGESASAKHGGKPSKGISHLRRDTAVWAVLAMLIGVVYWPVGRYDFLLWDDDGYVTNNLHVQAGLTWQTIQWAFTTFEQG